MNTPKKIVSGLHPDTISAIKSDDFSIEFDKRGTSVIIVLNYYNAGLRLNIKALAFPEFNNMIDAMSTIAEVIKYISEKD